LRPRFEFTPVDIPGVLSVLNEIWNKVDDIQKTHDEDTNELKEQYSDLKKEVSILRDQVTKLDGKIVKFLIGIVVAIAGRYGLDLSGVMQ
jgi:hypothetical protein